MKPLARLLGITAEELEILVVIGAGSFLLASSFTSINVALPQIQSDFGVSLSALKWVSIIGAIMVASLSLSFGRVGDLLGRRLVYKVGMLLYALAAGLSASSPSFGFLMAFRVLMATGLAMAMPLAGGIMAATAAPQRRGQVMGIFATFSAAGMLTGPTLGGFLLDVAGWRAIFLTNMSLGLTLCLAQQFVLKGAEERRREEFDYLGTLLLLVGYPALLLAFSFGPGSGWSSTITLGWFMLAGLGLGSFLVHESRCRVPLLRLAFFRRLPFSIAMFTLVVGAFISTPVTLFTPLYLQKGLGINPFEVGLIMMALPISTILTEPIGGRLADRHEPRVVAAAGIFITVVAIGLFARLGLHSPGVFVTLPLVLVGLGNACLRPANQVAVYATASPSEYGALSALIAMLGSLAGTLGTTVMVAINESHRSGTSPGSLVSAQQFTFAVLIPLVIVSGFVALLGKPKTGRPEAEDATEPAAAG